MKSFDEMTWKEKEETGTMSKWFYTKREHRCRICKYFYHSYFAWSCHLQRKKISVYNYNYNIDGIMDFLGITCPED